MDAKASLKTRKPLTVSLSARRPNPMQVEFGRRLFWSNDSALAPRTKRLIVARRHAFALCNLRTDPSRTAE